MFAPELAVATGDSVPALPAGTVAVALVTVGGGTTITVCVAAADCPTELVAFAPMVAVPVKVETGTKVINPVVVSIVQVPTFATVNGPAVQLAELAGSTMHHAVIGALGSVVTAGVSVRVVPFGV
jgi:hypothetical protein